MCDRDTLDDEVEQPKEQAPAEAAPAAAAPEVVRPEALTEAQVAKLRQTFQAIDLNADGILDRAEVVHLLQGSFPATPEDTLQHIADQVFATADKNRDGAIDFGEYLRSVSAGEGVLPAEVVVVDEDTERIRGLLTEEEIDGLRHVFLTLDADGDGFLSLDELRKALQEEFDKRFQGMSEGTKDELVRLVMQQADKDRDGKLGLKEFVLSFCEGRGVLSSDTVDRAKGMMRRRLRDWELEALKKTFQELDVNKDGFLDLSELRPELDPLLQQRFPDMPPEGREELMKKILHTADRDGDGRLSIAECIRSIVEEQGVLPPEFILKHGPAGLTLMEPEQVAFCVQAFAALDRNGDGFVDRSELDGALREAMGTLKVSGEQRAAAEEAVRRSAEHVMQLADKDHDGRIDLREFVRAFENSGGRGVLAEVGAISRDVVVAEAAAKAEEEQVKDLRRVFEHLDRNQDGVLQREELDHTMDALLSDRVPELRDDRERRQRVVTEIIQAADTNKDGLISLDEFVRSFFEGCGVLPIDYCMQLAHRLGMRLTQAEVDTLSAAFAGIDLNKDGFLDREELRQAVLGFLQQYVSLDVRVERQQAHWLEETLDAIMRAADVNEDGRVSLAEFVHSFARQEGIAVLAAAEHERQQHEAEVAALHELASHETLRKMKKVFESLDRNRDAFLDRDELSQLMHRLLKERCPELRDDEERRNQVMDVILQAVDTDKDGRISLDEFIASFYSDCAILPLEYVEQVADSLSRKLSKEEVELLKKLFRELDTDKDGRVTVTDLDPLLAEVIPDNDVRSEVIQVVVEASDTNADGVIDLTEFIRSFARDEGVGAVLSAAGEVYAVRRETEEALAALHALMTEEEMRRMARIFDHLDRNGDAFLDKGELSKLMHRLLRERCPELAEDSAKRDQTIDIILNAADVDKDGRISLEEFISSFYNDCGVLPIDYVHDMADKVSRRLTKEEVNALKEIFKMIDTNNDGVLTPDELDAQLQQLFSVPDEAMRAEIVALIIKASDRNADGRIDLTEFIRSFARDEGIGALLPEAIAQRVAVDDEVGHINATATPEPSPTSRSPERPRDPAAKAEPDMERSASPAAQQRNPVAVVQPQPPSPHLFPNDVTGAPVTDTLLAEEFRKFDKDGSGFLSRGEFKRAFMEMEWCGLEPTEREVDRLFGQFGGDDERLSYEEFCVLMLYRARI
eukprot:TRINITY_DN537_c0_g1_i1.p1 TRINITY_DN537_c0_g1~~TRINITY_DN537_c0_g1_i1.p1  ORF type:complete len:1226 (+),score=558.31 TRINITY_DN537_c0_g1_i1:87-3680(+)